MNFDLTINEKVRSTEPHCIEFSKLAMSPNFWTKSPMDLATPGQQALIMTDFWKIQPVIAFFDIEYNFSIDKIRRKTQKMINSDHDGAHKLNGLPNYRGRINNILGIYQAKRNIVVS